MSLSVIVLNGLREIWSHKVRSLLTMLGIVLGVSSLVAMSALVKGMELGMKEALAEIGGLEKIRVQTNRKLPLHQRHLADRVVGVTLKDVAALQEGAPLVHTIAPAVNLGEGSRSVVRYQNKRTRAWNLSGTWPSALDIEEHVIEHGRMFNELDNDKARKVCVIGTGIRDDLFGRTEFPEDGEIAVGKTINVNGLPFTVIGMFKHYESGAFRNKRLARHAALQAGDNAVLVGEDHIVYRYKNRTMYIPLNTMLVNFRTGSTINSISEAQLSTLYMKVSDVALLEKGLQQVRNVLMITHNGLEDFRFHTDETWAEKITTTIKNVRISGGIIAAICLIVGGIGIANIMLASISERIREIGVRKAVGATTLDVFTQVLAESFVLTAIGAVLGLGASFGLVLIVGQYSPTQNAPVITWSTMFFALSASSVVGILSGLFPAIKASRLHPIQALRFD